MAVDAGGGGGGSAVVVHAGAVKKIKEKNSLAGLTSIRWTGGALRLRHHVELGVVVDAVALVVVVVAGVAPGSSFYCLERRSHFKKKNEKKK